MDEFGLIPNESVIKKNDPCGFSANGQKISDTATVILTNLALIVSFKSVFGNKTVKGLMSPLRLPLIELDAQHGRPKVSKGFESGHDWLLNVSQAGVLYSFRLQTERKSLLDLIKSNEETVETWMSAIFEAYDNIQSVLDPTAAAAHTSPNVAQKQSSAYASIKCAGCHAPLTGLKGTQVTCSYCDTQQIIQ